MHTNEFEPTWFFEGPPPVALIDRKAAHERKREKARSTGSIKERRMFHSYVSLYFNPTSTECTFSLSDELWCGYGFFIHFGFSASHSLFYPFCFFEPRRSYSSSAVSNFFQKRRSCSFRGRAFSLLSWGYGSLFHGSGQVFLGSEHGS